MPPRRRSKTTSRLIGHGQPASFGLFPDRSSRPRASALGETERPGYLHVESRNGGPIGGYMAPRNVLLFFFFWLLAAAFCVTYVGVTTGPVPTGLSISSRQDDLQRLRDRSLRSWGPYLPRRVPSGKVPETAIAKAPTPPSERRTITNFEETKQRTLEVKAPPPVSETNKSFAEPNLRTPELPPAERKVPSSPDNPAAEVGGSTESAVLGVEAQQLESRLQRNAARTGKAKLTAKLSRAKKKVIAVRAPRKSRFARPRGGRGLGLFALSGDFRRP